MKISASVYAGKDKALEPLIRELDLLKVDYFHIDSTEEPENLDIIPDIRAISNHPIDVHIITEQPDRYLDRLVKYKPEFVCFQYEQLPGNFSFPEIEGVSFGLAIRTETGNEVFEPYSEYCDFLLLMATTPGQSGGQFDSENFRKARSFLRHFPNKNLHVDGGVNDEVSFILRSYGVHVAVVGSFLMGSDSQGRALTQLKHEAVESHFSVSDMMLHKEHLPVVRTPELDLRNILQTNEDYRFGYVLIEDEKGNFVGFSSNADIRRAMLKNLNNLNELSVDDLINRSAITINEKCSISEMFELMRSRKETISYLPVLSEDGKLRGAVNFNFLIKGEL